MTRQDCTISDVLVPDEHAVGTPGAPGSRHVTPRRGSSSVSGRPDRLPDRVQDTSEDPSGPMKETMMLKTTHFRTGAAALVLVGALGFGPGLIAGATAAPAQKSVAATKSMTSHGQAWNYTGTWTDKKGRTGQARISIVPQKFWNDSGTLMMRSAV